jgi:hypothetical protein
MSLLFKIFSIFIVKAIGQLENAVALTSIEHKAVNAKLITTPEKNYKAACKYSTGTRILS